MTTITQPRTLTNVEDELREAGARLVHHRSRQGDTVNNRDRCDGTPALLVHPVDWLLEEWAAMSEAG